MLRQIVCAKRVVSFLKRRDIDMLGETLCKIQHNPSKPLHIKGSIGWDEDRNWSKPGTAIPQNTSSDEGWHPDFKLQNIDVVFESQKMTLVAGKFGSGKTLMLLALLGEANLLEGSINQAASQVMPCNNGHEQMDWSLDPCGVAYVPQVAWLQSLSIRLVPHAAATAYLSGRTSSLACPWILSGTAQSSMSVPCPCVKGRE